MKPEVCYHSTSKKLYITGTNISNALVICEEIVFSNKNVCPLHKDIKLIEIHSIYSVLSIYRPRILRFLVFTVRYLRSRIKSHINNVIFSRNHRFPEQPFSRIHSCKKRSRHSISRINFSASIDWEKKFWSEIFMWELYA
jgi:hypothetical protein